MSKGLKIMFYWSLGFPVIVMILQLITDLALNRDIEWLSCSVFALRAAAAGLVIGGPLHYFILKSQGK